MFLLSSCSTRTKLAGTFLFLSLAMPAFPGTIELGTWYEFSFGDVGTVATGCDPADPTGGFCTPSSGTPTTFLDEPAWTFTAPALGAFLTVTDAFTSGDRFDILNFGASLGLTSVPTPGLDCGDDPVPCLADPGMSQVRFFLAPGDYSITLSAVEGGFGSGYLQVAPTPEPGSIILLGTGALAMLALRRRLLNGGSR